MSCKYKRAKAEMILHGYDIKEVARKMNCDPQFLQRRLRGAVELSLDDAVMFKRAINSNTPLEKLFEVSE